MHTVAAQSECASAALVAFQPDRGPTGTVCRRATSVVTQGVGRTGTPDGKVEEFRAGDVLWRPPGVKHWHGATPDSVMTHMAVTVVKDGQNTEWMEPVTDAQYNGK